MTVQVPDIINLTGSDEDDILAGDARVNTLRGGEGDDTLVRRSGRQRDQQRQDVR